MLLRVSFEDDIAATAINSYIPPRWLGTRYSGFMFFSVCVKIGDLAVKFWCSVWRPAPAEPSNYARLLPRAGAV
jgi:hypothetical protein